MNKQIVLVEPM